MTETYPDSDDDESDSDGEYADLEREDIVNEDGFVDDAPLPWTVHLQPTIHVDVQEASNAIEAQQQALEQLSIILGGDTGVSTLHSVEMDGATVDAETLVDRLDIDPMSMMMGGGMDLPDDESIDMDSEPGPMFG